MSRAVVGNSEEDFFIVNVIFMLSKVSAEFGVDHSFSEEIFFLKEMVLEGLFFLLFERVGFAYIMENNGCVGFFFVYGMDVCEIKPNLECSLGMLPSRGRELGGNSFFPLKVSIEHWLTPLASRGISDWSREV